MKQEDTAVQSFCARVIDFAHAVHGANSLTYLKGLKAQANRIEQEANGIQDIYGGRKKRKKAP